MPAVVARAIRIHPTSWKSAVHLRIEFIGIYRGIYIYIYIYISEYNLKGFIFHKLNTHHIRTFLFAFLENSIPRPLGMQDRFIQQSQLSFSSWYAKTDLRHESPWLTPGVTNGDRSWVPHHGIEGQWLKVDFLRLTKVTEIRTQGRPSTDEMWVTSYEVAFGNDGEQFKFYQRYGKTKVNNCVRCK